MAYCSRTNPPRGSSVSDTWIWASFGGSKDPPPCAKASIDVRLDMVCRQKGRGDTPLFFFYLG